MIEGTLLAESLRPGTRLENLSLTVRTISRYRIGAPAPGQPAVWCAIDFEGSEADAETLARQFENALDQPGRALAQAHGRTLGIPEEQLDWTV